MTEKIKERLMFYWPLIAFAIIHSGIAIWWASGMQSNQNASKASVEQSFQLRDEKIIALDKKVDRIDQGAAGALVEVKNSMRRLEDKMDDFVYASFKSMNEGK